MPVTVSFAGWFAEGVCSAAAKNPGSSVYPAAAVSAVRNSRRCFFTMGLHYWPNCTVVSTPAPIWIFDHCAGLSGLGRRRTRGLSGPRGMSWKVISDYDGWGGDHG